MLAGGIRPHLYCLPILKTEPDRLALVEAACSGSSLSFWVQIPRHTVLAPKNHRVVVPDVLQPFAIPLYLEVFDSQDALENFEAFASLNGPNSWFTAEYRHRCLSTH